MQAKVYNTEKVSAFPREHRLHKMSLVDATKYQQAQRSEYIDRQQLLLSHAACKKMTLPKLIIRLTSWISEEGLQKFCWHKKWAAKSGFLSNFNDGKIFEASPK